MKIEVSVEKKIMELLELIIKERRFAKGENISIENLCSELIYDSVKHHHPFFKMSLERNEPIILKNDSYKFKNNIRSK